MIRVDEAKFVEARSADDAGTDIITLKLDGAVDGWKWWDIGAATPNLLISAWVLCRTLRNVCLGPAR